MNCPVLRFLVWVPHRESAVRAKVRAQTCDSLSPDIVTTELGFVGPSKTGELHTNRNVGFAASIHVELIRYLSQQAPCAYVPY